MSNKRDQKARLREDGGRHIKSIYLKPTKVFQLVGLSPLLILFYVIVDPFSYDSYEKTLNEVDILSIFMLALGILVFLFAVFYLLVHYVKVYENALVCRRFFRRRILFPRDIDHIAVRTLRDAPVKNVRLDTYNKTIGSMDTFDWSAGSNLYVCIKPVEGSELRYTFRSYGAGLGAVIDWQAEQRVPDENGDLLGAE